VLVTKNCEANDNNSSEHNDADRDSGDYSLPKVAISWFLIHAFVLAIASRLYVPYAMENG
jgi:hypothetical protein